jgi:glycosyltransferase involved in cell wall biosynthesis
VVFAVSDNLLKNMRVSKALGTCVPNGISGDLEITANWSLPPLPSGPRACYVGRIDERLDLDLISYLAKKNQDIQFVFIGPIEPSFRKQWSMVVGELSNVHAWGTVPYLNVGAALKSMDVCLMPHLDTPLTRSMDPLKIYVYLAAGKKVVSTKVQMTARMEKLISTAETNDEFSNVLRRCIESKNGATLNLLDELWENRVRQMEKPLRAQSTFLVA